MGLVMPSNGDDPAKVTAERLRQGDRPAAEGGRLGPDPPVHRQRLRGRLLAKGSILACIAWSGDIVQLQPDNPNLKFVIPDDGGMIWTDNMMIPTGGDVFTASTFMDFVYDPKIAAQIEAYVNYICPVEGAKDEMLKLDPDIANNHADLPRRGDALQGEDLRRRSADNKDYKEQFQAVIGA